MTIYVIIVGRNERRKNKDDSGDIEKNWLFYWHECTKKALMTSVPKSTNDLGTKVPNSQRQVPLNQTKSNQNQTKSSKYQ